MKTAPVFLLIPFRMQAYCPACFGVPHPSDSEAVITVYPMAGATPLAPRGDRWIGDCPRCKVRVTIILPPSRVTAEWDETTPAAAPA